MCEEGYFHTRSKCPVKKDVEILLKYLAAKL